MTQSSNKSISQSRSTWLARLEPAPRDPGEGGSRRSAMSASTGWNRKMRQDILDWISQNGRAEHMRLLPDGAVFNIVFVETDDYGAGLLEHAPHVLGIVPSDSVQVELLAAENVSDKENGSRTAS